MVWAELFVCSALSRRWMPLGVFSLAGCERRRFFRLVRVLKRSDRFLFATCQRFQALASLGFASLGIARESG